MKRKFGAESSKQNEERVVQMDPLICEEARYVTFTLSSGIPRGSFLILSSICEFFFVH